MNFLDLTLPEAAANLALDEALLLEAEAGRGAEVLRTWEWPQWAVVLGSGGCLAEDVEESACVSEAVPVLRRSSGGGTVLLGRGCLCYSLVLAYARHPALREIPFSYVYILEHVRSALHSLLPGIERAGTSDLMANGCKFSGTAQQRSAITCCTTEPCCTISIWARSAATCACRRASRSTAPGVHTRRFCETCRPARPISNAACERPGKPTRRP